MFNPPAVSRRWIIHSAAHEKWTRFRAGDGVGLHRLPRVQDSLPSSRGFCAPHAGRHGALRQVGAQARTERYHRRRGRRGASAGHGGEPYALALIGVPVRVELIGSLALFRPAFYARLYYD